MPRTEDYDNQDEWMAACVPQMMQDNEGMDKDQAVAACLNMWRSEKAIPSDDPDDYLVVEDREKPTTWHLQVKESGKPNHRLMGAAWAALHGGFRGSKYDGPRKQEAIDKLRRLYEQEEMEPPSDKSLKYGMRNSKLDQAALNTAHDALVQAGAYCPGVDGEARGILPELARKNTLKAIGKTEDELRVANYIILFGGRDLTGFVPKEAGGGPNPDGSLGEYFSPRTDLSSEYTKSGVLHVDFEHGYDPDQIGNHKDNVLGYVDWKTARMDKYGVYVERVLKRRNEYMQWLESLIEEGLIGNSTEAVPGLVEKSPNGEILKWGLRRDTLTVTPMEPRMLTENAVNALKHLANVMPSAKAVLNITGDEDFQKAEEIGGEDAESVLETTKTIGAEAPKENLKMNDKEEKEVAEEKPVQPQQTEAQPKQAKALEIDYDLLAEKISAKIDAPMPAKSAPAVISADNLGDPDPYRMLTLWGMGERVKGLGAFTPTGVYAKNASLKILENSITFSWKSTSYLKAALQEDTASEGGYLVPNAFFPRIIAKRDEASIPRKAGALIIPTNRDYVDIPYEDASMSDFTEVAEEAAVSESEPTFGNAQARVYNYRRLVKASEELLEDDATNLGELLADSTGRAVAAAENARTLTGTGSSQPQGVFVGGSVGYTFADTNSISASEIASLFWSLGEPYHEEAVWIMRGATMGHLQGLTGNPFSFTTTPVADTFKNMFFGNKPYYLSDKVAALGTGAKTVLIGNWRFYGMVERRQLTFSRNPYLYQANGQIGLFWSMRFGGVVLQSEAFKWGIQA